LQADGQDVAFFDVEVVDANGQRCPTDDARVDFTCSGPGIWRGGYNSGKTDSTNNLFLNTELGINRVFVRSTLTAGTIIVAASRSALKGRRCRLFRSRSWCGMGWRLLCRRGLRGRLRLRAGSPKRYSGGEDSYLCV